ncbi:uncharacterized protein LOC135116171 isoform X3 [Scylla paramamosain]|uniref:uncharacterized protein LOC135116171 isoform X3 n=1 Tax=Scylla paramamosain TaxID=85552 RepID=UPI003082E56B
MDWLRKLLGYHGRPREDDNPFRSPTWDEIRNQRDMKDLQDSQEMQHPWGHFFHGDMFSPHQELFGQVDDMFSRLEDMMKEMHRHPAWALPDLQTEPEPQNPRDFMLKVPDDDQARTVPAPAPRHPLHGHEDEMPGSQSGHDDFSQHRNPFTFSPHSFFDGIFQQFGMHPSETPFPGHLPEIGPGSDHEDHSRESLMKKEDSDIDDRVLGDLSKLPEGGPGYSHGLPQIVEPRRSPWSHPESPGSPHAGVRHKFYSQSIVTIRRPDGSIEETKKYSDSTGREEVIVTHKQPEDGSSGIGSLQPEGPLDQRPSIFSWFFTR